MKLRKALLLLALFPILLTGFSSASATDVPSNKYLWPPVWNGKTDVSAQPITHYAFEIVDTFNSGSTDWSFIRVATPGPQPLCSSLNDSYCVPLAQKYGWWIIRVLPACKSATDLSDCIEGLSIASADGQKRELRFLKTLEKSGITADPVRGLGEGSGSSLWVEKGSDDSTGYMVTVSGDAGGSFSSSSFPLQNFAATVVPYKKYLGDFKALHWSINDTTHQGQGSSTNAPLDCIWTDTGECGVTSEFPEDSRISLRMHLPASMTGWLIGRLKTPNINVEEISPSMGEKIGVNRVTVDALPVNLPMVAAAAPVNEATPLVLGLWKDNICPECEHGIWGVNVASSNPNAFDMLKIFDKWIGNKALLSVPTWSVSSLIGSTQELVGCNKVSRKLQGLVTTNATAYEGKPPTFDGTSLNYKLAGVHYAADGTVFQGSYDLLLSSDAARCLYKFTNAPIQAVVSVTSSDGETRASTSVLSEKDGWLHLAAYGFTFSTPTIKIQLTQSKATPVIAKRTTITCVKGKVSKSITAIKPTCPSGYKKK